jgi:thiol-disulfide isomerase/thioredoxin
MFLKQTVLLSMFLAACASSSPPPPPHGTISDLTTSAGDLTLCEHRVPAETCTRCHPELAAKFKAVNDWCVEHDVAESQCLICHPDLTFEPLPELPPTADVKKISAAGEDVASLESHAVAGKVTLFDFYADWCAPCRKVDHHVYKLMQTRSDIALRKINIVSWDTPVAKRHLSKVESLPYVIVFGKNGQQSEVVTGFDLAALDRAITAAEK